MIKYITLFLIPLSIAAIEPSFGISVGSHLYTEFRITHKDHQLALTQGITDIETRPFLFNFGYRFLKRYQKYATLSSGISLSFKLNEDQIDSALYFPITVDYHFLPELSLFGEYGFTHTIETSPKNRFSFQLGIRYHFIPPATPGCTPRRCKPKKIYRPPSKAMIAKLKHQWQREQQERIKKEHKEEARKARLQKQRRLSQRKKRQKLTREKRLAARKMECETYYFYLLSLINNYPRRAVFPRKAPGSLNRMSRSIKNSLKKQRHQIIQSCVDHYNARQIDCILQSQTLDKGINCNDPLTLEYGINLTKAGEYYRCNYWLKTLKPLFRGRKWEEKITPSGYTRPRDELTWFRKQILKRRGQQKLCTRYPETVQLCVLEKKTAFDIINCIPELQAARELRHERTRVTLTKPKTEPVKQKKEQNGSVQKEDTQKNDQKKRKESDQKKSDQKDIREKKPEKQEKQEKQKPSGVDLPW